MNQCLKIYIKNEITDRCILMYSIDSHEKQHPSYDDDSIISGGKSIPPNLTIEALN